MFCTNGGVLLEDAHMDSTGSQYLSKTSNGTVKKSAQSENAKAFRL